ncbi:hypothetical protein [Saccharibacillus qingshengii]|uniref:hypothetical protein n=1 Tax=Saccharibacillus qingshengii TaxID=1763540 RepID=UPI0015573F6F|nr:hypothetical protein [Saccharibacillus qingshengii]
MGAAKVLEFGRQRVREARDFTRTMGGKVATVAGGATGAVAMASTKMFAAETTVTDSIATSMGTLKTDALVALGSVAAVGIVLFAGPYVWRYAKRVFKTVAS